MGDREEWRFQWPDGTWIHWNPRTQSWEKETGGSASAPVIPDEPATKAPNDVVEEPDAEPELEPELEPEPEPEPEPRPQPAVAQEAEVVPGADAADVPVDETLGEPVEERATESEPRERYRGRRSAIGDVLPPRPEPERPGGRLWPTIVAGAVLGVGVGLFLWELIR